ncbi:VTT domain-containing protein [Gottfriedia acidiceleris]|uniref:VTT domain-containing protein n=1 Tax=Gottfriedia acidiceleris TaxID=371036 RepID=UPI003B585BF4
MPNFIHDYQIKNNINSFVFILLLRILPFIPSSVVTLLAAIGSINFINFLIASSIGKIPSLFLEVYSMNTLLKIANVPILISVCSSLWLLFFFFKKKKK